MSEENRECKESGANGELRWMNGMKWRECGGWRVDEKGRVWMNGVNRGEVSEESGERRMGGVWGVDEDSGDCVGGSGVEGEESGVRGELKRRKVRVKNLRPTVKKRKIPFRKHIWHYFVNNFAMLHL